MNDPNVENFLEHYGVLGMKWGIRKGRADQSYAKAYDKLRNLSYKGLKTRAKAERKQMSSEKRYIESKSNKKAARALKGTRKAARLNDRADRQFERAVKWYKKVEKTFANAELTAVRKEDIDIGKLYAQKVLSERTR